MYDAATRSSTPDAGSDVDVEIKTSSPVVVESPMLREPLILSDPEPDLRLTTVSSEPTTSSEMWNIESAIHGANAKEDTQKQRAKTIPFRSFDRSVADSRPPNGDPAASDIKKQVNGLLHQALIDENTYKVMSLLTTDIDVNELGRDNRTPLHVCALLNDKVTAHALLRTGRADLSLRDIHGRTPLQCALEVGNESLACLLLQQGANIGDVAHFIIDMTHRMRKPAEEKIAHACLAWLSKQDNFDKENHFVDALVAGSGSSTGGVARFLEGTPFREPFVQRSSLRTRSRSMDGRRRGAGTGLNASRNRSGVEEYFGMDAAVPKVEQHDGSSMLSNPIIQNSVLWRVSEAFQLSRKPCTD